MDIGGMIRDVIGLALKAKELADKLKDLEMKGVIVDLQGKLLDLKEQINELREENIHLKAEANKLSLPPDVELRKGLYYKTDGAGPFCPACYAGEEKLIPLNPIKGGMVRVGDWKCPGCNAKLWNED